MIDSKTLKFYEQRKQKSFQKMELVLKINTSPFTQDKAPGFIEPILMHECEILRILKQLQKKPEATEMRFLPRILRISWTVKKSKENSIVIS